MRKFKSILLIIILGMTIFPWQLVCLTHPFGHDHHEHVGPSNCELHKMVANQPGEHLLPPMDCKHISETIDDFDQTRIEKVVPNIQLVAIAEVVFDLIGFETTEQPFLLPPDPKCRSATLISDNPLRGPPSV